MREIGRERQRERERERVRERERDQPTQLVIQCFTNLLLTKCWLH